MQRPDGRENLLDKNIAAADRLNIFSASLWWRQTAMPAPHGSGTPSIFQA